MTALAILKEQLQYKMPQIRLAVIRENDVIEPLSVRSPHDVEKILEPLRHCSEEYFIAFHLDARMNITSYHEVSHGTLTSSLVHPREVFKTAMLNNCERLLVAHNHPAGSLNPSLEDLNVTKQLVEAGALLGIGIVDHVIVTYHGHISLREKYEHLFTAIQEVR